VYDDMAGHNDGASYGDDVQDTSGVGHYFDIMYKF
jgi:hypothetical protein